MAIIHLTKDNFDSTVASGKVVVDFWASWCGPCRMQSPILEQFAEAHQDVAVCKVDQDGNLINKTVGVQSLAQIAAAMGV